MKKAKFGPPLGSLCPQLWGGGSSAASPLKIWVVMPPYLKPLLEHKT